MDWKLNLLKRPARSAGAAMSDAKLKAWAATERDPEMREVLQAYTNGTPVSSDDLTLRALRAVTRPWVVLCIWLPVLIWFLEGVGNTRLLDAPFGYLGTLYHHLPGMLRMSVALVPFFLSVYLVHIQETDTDGRRWPVAALACYVLLSCWQLVPPTVTRWFGTPHVEVAQVIDSQVRSLKSGGLVPTRLVVARPGGKVESIDYYGSYRESGDERRVGLKTGPGDWVRLSGERTALGFFVHHVDRAPTPP